MTAYRAGWQAFATAYPYTDVFGVQHKLSGNAMFTKLNKNLDTLGLGAILLAPVTVSTQSPGLVTITYSPGTTLALGADTIAGGYTLYPILSGTLVLGAVSVTGPTTTYVVNTITGPNPIPGQLLTTTGYTAPGNNVTGIPVLSYNATTHLLTVATTTQVTATGPGAGTTTGPFPSSGQLLTVTGYALTTENISDQPITAVDPIGMTVSVATTTQVGGGTSGTGAVTPSVIITPSIPPLGTEAAIIRASKPMSPGVLKFSNTQTILQTFPAGSAPPWDVGPAYYKKHKSAQAGSLIFIILNYVTISTGWAGLQVIATFLW